MSTDERHLKMTKVASQRQSDIMVILEDVHDPHNAQAVCRSCDAMGIQDIGLVFENQAPFNPKKVGKKTSSSANQWLSFHTFDSTTAAIDYLKNNHYQKLSSINQSIN